MKFVYLALGVFAFVSLVWYIFKKKHEKPHDTFYFCVVDNNGVKSCGHDSGIKPSSNPSKLKLCALKTEYNDGIEKKLDGVSKVYLGRHYTTMKPISVEQVVDVGEWYEIYVDPKHN